MSNISPDEHLNKDNEYSFKKFFIKGELIYGFWNIVYKILSLGNSFIIVFYLTLYDFGFYKLITAFAGLASILLLDGLNSVITTDIIRYFSEERKPTGKRIFYEYAVFKISVGAILSASVFLLADFIAVYYKTAGSYLRIISVFFVLDAVRSVSLVFLRATFRFNLVGLVPVIMEISKLIYILLMTQHFKKFGVTESVISYVLPYIVVDAMLLLYGLKRYIFTKKKELFGGADDRGILFRTMKTYGKWAVINTFVSAGEKNIRPVLLKIFVSTEAVGIYSLAIMLHSLFIDLFPVKALSSLIPKEITNDEKLRDILVRGTKYFIVLGVMMALIAALVVPVVVDLLIPKYNEAIPFFYFSLIIFLLYGCTKLNGVVLIASRRQDLLFVCYIVYGISIITFSMTILPLAGLWGAVGEYIITFYVMSIMFHIQVIKIKPFLKIKFKELISFDKYDKEHIKSLFKHLRASLKL